MLSGKFNRTVLLLGIVMVTVLGAEKLHASNESQTVELTVEEMERNAQLVNLRVDEGYIRLDDTVLIEDDGPAVGFPEGAQSYRTGPVDWVEDLKRGVVLKKNLIVENPEATSGRVVSRALNHRGIPILSISLLMVWNLCGRQPSSLTRMPDSLSI
jgi:hypothetical protein